MMEGWIPLQKHSEENHLMGLMGLVGCLPFLLETQDP